MWPTAHCLSENSPRYSWKERMELVSLFKMLVSVHSSSQMSYNFTRRILRYLQTLWPFSRLACILTSVTGLILTSPANAPVTRQILFVREMRMAKEIALSFLIESFF